MSGSQTDRKRPFAAVEGDFDSAADGAKRFFTSGQFSDLTLMCKGQEWKVHRFHLCAQLQYFHTLCTSWLKEAHENKITLDEDDPKVIQAVLSYLYEGVYQYPDRVHEHYKDDYDELYSEPVDSFQQPKVQDGRLLFDADVFIAADKFFIAKLKDAAASMFQTQCQKGWASKDFPVAITKLYQVPAGFYTALKTSIMTEVVKNAADLLRNKFKYAAFHAAMRSNADFSTAVAINLAFKEPEKVVVEKVVEKIVDRPVDRAVDRIVHVNDPTLKKLLCPHCGQLFAIGPTPTPRTEFGCPRNCVRSRGPGWWAKHAVQ